MQRINIQAIKEYIKSHYHKHEKAYKIAGAVVLIAATAGITYLIMRRSLSDVPRASLADVPRASSPAVQLENSPSVFNSTAGNDINVTTNIYQGMKGHPGFVTRCTETGDIFKSQQKAAEFAKAPASAMSGHLKGKLEDVNGLHFERVVIQ